MYKRDYNIIYAYTYTCIHTQWNVIQLSEKKEFLPFVTTWMDPMLNEVSQTEKYK